MTHCLRSRSTGNLCGEIDRLLHFCGCTEISKRTGHNNDQIDEPIVSDRMCVSAARGRSMQAGEHVSDEIVGRRMY